MEPLYRLDQFLKALEHAINYDSIDAKVGMADWKLVELLTPEIQAHLEGRTDVQRFERGEFTGRY